MKKKFQSAYKGYSVYSFLVSWMQGKQECRIETLSRSEAQILCSNMKEKYGAVCHKIKCSTGEKIEKIA